MYNTKVCTQYPRYETILLLGLGFRLCKTGVRYCTIPRYLSELLLNICQICIKIVAHEILLLRVYLLHSLGWRFDTAVCGQGLSIYHDTSQLESHSTFLTVPSVVGYVINMHQRQDRE